MSWILPRYTLPTDKFRIDLRRVTDARQLLCQVVKEDKTVIISNFTTMLEFTNLMTFSLYHVQFTALLSISNVTLRQTDTSREFTTLKIGIKGLA